MQYADLMKPDEDWRGLEDPLERRKIQNRIAQRAYRRNMRERANEVKQLKQQLRTYEEFHLHNAQDEDGTYQESSSSPPILLPNKRGVGDWYPLQQPTPSVSQGKVSRPNDSQFSRVQWQVCPVIVEQQPPNNQRLATRQQAESWVSTNSQRIVVESQTPAPSVSMEDGIKPDDILPLSPIDISALSDDFTFDTTKLANKSQQLTSLLHMAVAGNHIDTIKVLLQDERIIIDEKDSDGFTPLQRAVMHGRSEIVKLLLDYIPTSL
ncbi:hypothetical protein GGI43DRAFT_416220 [Trichoderma evansii]